MNVLLLAAVYREIGGVVRRYGARRRTQHGHRSYHVSYLSHQITIGETGMGTAAASRNGAWAIDTVKPDLVISCGYAGALAMELQVGDILLASAVQFVNGNSTDAIALHDAMGLRAEMASSLAVHDGTLVTMDRWREKHELLRLIHGVQTLAACDMETHALARLCREKHVPFLSLRVITDGLHDEVPFDPSRLCNASGDYSALRSIAFFLAHPRLLPALPKLRRASAIATRNLTHAVDHLLHLL